jgi:hypothetical protein
MTTHPTPEAPSDGLIELLREPSGGRREGECQGCRDALCEEAAEALTQAAARIQEADGVQGAALDAHEALSTLCEWFGQREAGQATTNSEMRMFERCHQASSMLDSAFKLAPGPSPLAVATARIQVLEGERKANDKILLEAAEELDATRYIAARAEAENGRMREALTNIAENSRHFATRVVARSALTGATGT